MVSEKIAGILDAARDALNGNPARFIGYGAAIVIVGVSLVSNALGFTRIPPVDLPTALGLTTTAILTVVGIIESIRKFVYSPNTVEKIKEDAKAAALDTDVPNGGNG